MKLLNALPAKKRREIYIWFIISIISFFIFLSFSIFVIINKTKKIFALKQEYFKLSYEVGDFALRQKEKKNLEDKNKYLEKKFNHLQNYSQNGAKLAYAFLEGISNAMPEQLFLTELNFDYKKKELNLIGFCWDIFVLTEFMDKLAELDVSEHIKLGRLTNSESKEYPLQFSIFIQLKEI